MSNRLLIISMTFLFSVSSFAGLSKQDQDAAEQILQVYKLLNPSIIAKSINVASSSSDIGFLNSTFKNSTNPKATLKGENIHIEGSKLPLKIMNLQSGKFTLDGYVLDFQSPISIEKQITKIQKILDGDHHSNWTSFYLELTLSHSPQLQRPYMSLELSSL